MAVGTATLAFGATPAGEASVAVTGQGSILTTSQVEAWIEGATTADNDENMHLMAGALMRVTCGIPVAATGFTIYADVLAGEVTGDFTVSWAWV